MQERLRGVAHQMCIYIWGNHLLDQERWTKAGGESLEGIWHDIVTKTMEQARSVRRSMTRKTKAVKQIQGIQLRPEMAVYTN